jgi:hypothetical protein
LPKQKPLSQIPSFKKIFPNRERQRERQREVEQKQANSRSIPHQKTSTKGEKNSTLKLFLNYFFPLSKVPKKNCLATT